ncbi:sensor histidine kinase [Fulvimarina endophytica]|uniref:histidine kinase n=1 Tax=Fulvimarina endophytica TaxID=2293836 RepID=A0A371X5H8_9HYPH|nr:HAMP domain-containing sensor histidine kinase [Fulvimarina endophytica]RFC64483.1 sensor histidine kinase [Fulvimarina endophytica]
MSEARSLLGLVARRILLFATLAVAIQSVVVFVSYWFDEDELGRIMVEHETETIASAFLGREGDPDLDIIRDRYGIGGEAEAGSDASGRSPDARAGYRILVQSPAGVLYDDCGIDCAHPLLVPATDPPDFWFRIVEPGMPLSIVGGRRFREADGTPLVVEFAAIDDPRSLVLGVLTEEMVEHMAWPMGLLLFLVFGATTLSIRSALRPMDAVVAAADAIDPRRSLQRLPGERLPREILRLVGAVNRAFDRAEALIGSQKIFAASIAHEIRTPVSIVKLELSRIDHPRARKAEGDIDGLTHVLEQLTALARLDAVEAEAFTFEPLGTFVEGVVEDIAPLVFGSGRTIAFERAADPRVRISRTLATTLVRNLVENAIKHTPAGTQILVRVEAPATILVVDDGPGFGEGWTGVDTGIASVKSTGSLGLGLKIADRIAAILGGSLTIAPGRDRGARITVALPAP